MNIIKKLFGGNKKKKGMMHENLLIAIVKEIEEAIYLNEKVKLKNILVSLSIFAEEDPTIEERIEDIMQINTSLNELQRRCVMMAIKK